MALKSYKELIVWQKAVDLVTRVYEFTKLFPKDETFGLRQQLRRAAVSIPSNIAEGQCRSTTKDFLHFLAIARGSLAELDTQVLISQRLAYLPDEQASEIFERLNEIGRMISGLQNSLTERTG